MDQEKIKQFLINVCLKLARQGKGGFFIIKENEFDYDLLLEQDINPFNIFDNQRRLELLSQIYLNTDGACVIDPDGNLISYAAQVKNVEALKNFGTRHSAAHTVSIKGNVAIIASEEDRKVRIFENGNIVQMDPFEKEINAKVPEAIGMMELLPKSLSVGVAGAVGTSIAASVPIGVVLIPGVTVFAVGYMATELIRNYMNRK